jgi:enamine deaminase RidA (YjgF/YER057c/UK114 family)
MPNRQIDAPDAPTAVGDYAQAIEVTETSRRLYISGQIPVAPDGTVPTTFEAQARQVWANVNAQLRAADMEIAHLVKVTTYLSDRAYREVNSEVRREVLQNHRPALTIIICGIYDPTWLLEIEAVAEA